jgi:hypothetical protein
VPPELAPFSKAAALAFSEPCTIATLVLQLPLLSSFIVSRRVASLSRALAPPRAPTGVVSRRATAHGRAHAPVATSRTVAPPRALYRQPVSNVSVSPDSFTALFPERHQSSSYAPPPPRSPTELPPVSHPPLSHRPRPLAPPPPPPRSTRIASSVGRHRVEPPSPPPRHTVPSVGLHRRLLARWQKPAPLVLTASTESPPDHRWTGSELATMRPSAR